MAGITLEQAEARLQKYLDAEEKVLKGQKVEIDGKALTRADLTTIQAGIATWDARAKELAQKASGRGRAITVRPGF